MELKSKEFENPDASTDSLDPKPKNPLPSRRHKLIDQSSGLPLRNHGRNGPHQRPSLRQEGRPVLLGLVA